MLSSISLVSSSPSYLNPRVIPGICVLAASVVGVVSAFVFQSPYLAIPAGVGFFGGIYATYMGHTYHKLESFHRNNQKLAETNRSLSETNESLNVQVQDFQMQVTHMTNRNQELEEKTSRFEKLNTLFQSNLDQLKGQMLTQIGYLSSHQEERAIHFGRRKEWDREHRKQIQNHLQQQENLLQNIETTFESLRHWQRSEIEVRHKKRLHEIAREKEELQTQKESLQTQTQELKKEILHLQETRNKIGHIVEKLDASGEKIREVIALSSSPQVEYDKENTKRAPNGQNPNIMGRRFQKIS